MILSNIFEYNLHISKGKTTQFFSSTPSKLESLPAVVSTPKGNFIVVRHLGPPKVLREWRIKDPKTGATALMFSPDEWDETRIYSHVFRWDSDRLDDVIGNIFTAAKDLALSEGWENVFSGRGAARRAFNYVKSSSGMVGQPHVCLVPDEWDSQRIGKFFGKRNLDPKQFKYNRYCRVLPAKVAFPVFLSHPDKIGVYTQFLGGDSSIILYNVKLGVGFCP